MAMVAITGDTYPVKEQLRALGGRWDAAQKVWMVPEDKAEIARTLATPREEYVCNECGATLYRPWCSGCRDPEMIERVR